MKTIRRRFEDQRLARYQEYVTPFVFKKTHVEYEKAVNVTFATCEDSKATTTYGTEVTISRCECEFFKSMDLPCKHIFSFCRQNDLDPFLPHLCATRWTKHYYNKSHPALNLDGNVPVSAPIYIQAVRTPHEKDKYKSVAAVTKELNTLISTLPHNRYNYVMDKLKNFKEVVADPNGDVAMNEESDDVDMNIIDGPEPTVSDVGTELVQAQQANETQTATNQFAQNGWINNWPLYGTIQNSTRYFSNATQINPNSAQMLPNLIFPIATQVNPNSTQLLPNPTLMLPVATQMIPNGSEVFLNATQIPMPSTQMSMPSTFQRQSEIPTNEVSAGAGIQSQLTIVKANRNQLKKIQLPTKMKSIGRPKGTVTNVVGTMKKAKGPNKSKVEPIPVLRLKVLFFDYGFFVFHSLLMIS